MNSGISPSVGIGSIIFGMTLEVKGQQTFYDQIINILGYAGLWSILQPLSSATAA